MFQQILVKNLRFKHFLGSLISVPVPFAYFFPKQFQPLAIFRSSSLPTSPQYGGYLKVKLDLVYK